MVTDVVIPAGHDLKATEKEEPTCTAPGTEAYWTCQRQGCGKKFSDAEGKNEIQEPVSIPKDDNNHAGPIVDVKGYAATCMDTGLTDGKQCEACKAFTVEQQAIPALGHTEAADPAVPATCTETGLTEGKHCSVCGTVLLAQETTPALGHTPAEAFPAKAPTCTEPGFTDQWACAVCGEITKASELIPALGHTPAAAVKENEKAPGCKGEGSYDEAVYCAVCGAELRKKTVSVPALGHDYRVTERTIIRISYACARCGEGYWEYNASSRSLLPGLVRDEQGKNVDYTAGVSMEKGSRILTVKPDLPKDEAQTASLWLKPEDVKQWIGQGVSMVRFQRNGAALEIELAAITPDCFALDPEAGKISFFVFTLDPGDDGVLVEVNAVLDDQKIPAVTLSGITLKLGEAEVSVTENGMYPAE